MRVVGKASTQEEEGKEGLERECKMSRMLLASVERVVSRRSEMWVLRD